MATQALPSPEVLRQLLRYDADTGKLFWVPRTKEQFSNKPETAEASCASWNTKWAWREALNTDAGKGYLKGSIFYRQLFAHRVIWAMVYGEWPEQIDHINGDRSDNRIANLRAATNLDNSRNKAKPKNNTSGVVGVCRQRDRDKWVAQITVGYVVINLGRYSSFEDAVAARKSAELKYGFHPNHGRVEERLA